MTGNHFGLPLAAAFITVIVWAFAFPASRAALPYFTVEQIVLFRYTVACLFYLLFFLFGKVPLPKTRDLPVPIILGLFGIAIYQLFFVFGMGKVAGGAAAMIIAANPVCSALLARVFLSEKLSNMAWAGIIVSVLGIAVISLIKGTDGEPIGYLALLVAVVSISIYFVFQKPFFKRYSPMAMTSYTCLGGTLPLVFFYPGRLMQFPRHRLPRCCGWLPWAYFQAASGFCCGFMPCRNCVPVLSPVSFFYSLFLFPCCPGYGWVRFPRQKPL